jgi:hypothetical protein
LLSQLPRMSSYSHIYVPLMHAILNHTELEAGSYFLSAQAWATHDPEWGILVQQYQECFIQADVGLLVGSGDQQGIRLRVSDGGSSILQLGVLEQFNEHEQSTRPDGDGDISWPYIRRAPDGTAACYFHDTGDDMVPYDQWPLFVRGQGVTQEGFLSQHPLLFVRLLEMIRRWIHDPMHAPVSVLVSVSQH